MTTTRTHDQWRDVAHSTILWRVTDDPAERAALLDRVAEKCVETESNGETASIWHSLSLVTGHQCNCAPCTARRYVAA